VNKNTFLKIMFLTVKYRAVEPEPERVGTVFILGVSGTGTRNTVPVLVPNTRKGSE
jgi:hypothetical protein